MADRQCPTKKQRRNGMSHGEKILLIAAVKARSRIWDLADPQHSDTTAVSASWREIAAELNKTVEQCKMAWSSLRDSRRYYASVNSGKKSGDAGGDPLNAPEAKDSGDWEYSEPMSFLPNVAAKRRTFKSMALGPEIDELESSGSNYAYASCSTPQKCDSPLPNVENSSEQKIADGIDYLINQRKLKNQNKSASVDYIQHLLKKLPEEKAEILCFEFIDKLQREVQLEFEKTKAYEQIEYLE